MRLQALLCCTAVCLHVWTVKANVEKTVFIGPSPATLPDVHGIGSGVDVLDPAHSTLLATRLPVHFPTAAAPRGLDSWYLLQGLEEGRRYEVRICWPATVCIRLSRFLCFPLDFNVFVR